MTAYEKARKVIADYVGEGAAAVILSHLDKKRIGFMQYRGSADMLKRFHAHARFLAQALDDRSYEELKGEAKEYALGFNMWPSKTLVLTVEAAGEEFTIDKEVALTSTVATNEQLLKAYEYITQTAEEHGIRLPENVYA